MASNLNYSFSYICVPKNDGIASTAQNCRSLRPKPEKPPPAHSRQHTKLNYSSSIPTGKPHHNPDRGIFICAATPLKHGGTAGEPEWIGQVRLRRPLSRELFTLPEEAGQPPQISGEEEERWQMLILFTLPDHRGLGLGAEMCRNAFDYPISHRESPRALQVHLVIKLETHATI
jgi:GNAT superfamily N-acetyltransferase